MPRLVPTLALLALAACDPATEPVMPAVSETPAFAAAGKSVDPSALTPAPPPDTQAECQADGRWIVCHTLLSIELVNQPLVDFPQVPCGTIYETSTDIRHGIRWYNAADSVIVKRHVTQSVEGTYNLAADGSGPTVIIEGSSNWYDRDYADPNDFASGIEEFHGEITARAPGVGVIAHLAGLDDADGHHGTFRFPDDPAVAAKLCAALTR
jgi:hypothetical protein